MPVACENPWGLRQRLFLALAVPLVVVAIVSAGLDFLVARDTANSAHDAALADAVFDLEAHFRTHDQGGAINLAEEAEAMIRSSAPDMLYFSVKNRQGTVLAGDIDLPDFPAAPGKVLNFSDGRFRESRVRAVVHRFRSANDEFTVQILETTKKRQESSRRILSAMILPNLAVIFVTLVIVLLGVRQGLLPLRALEQEIANRSVTDLSEIPAERQPFEIRPVVRRLNELFALLSTSQAAQQRFIGDAAHQLRTPLAGLQTQLDLATQEGVFKAYPERQGRLEEASTRIGHLLNQLLVFARAENAQAFQRAMETVDLSALVEKAASVFIDRALAKEIDLGFEIESVEVQGMPWLLGEALNNLIDNALRYTPSGGVITVRCGIRDASPYLEVDDNGPGIADAHLPHVFERFFRAPGAGSDGCGLGLPIVQEIASLHAAEISLVNLPDGGLRSTLRFPPST